MFHRLFQHRSVKLTGDLHGVYDRIRLVFIVNKVTDVGFHQVIMTNIDDRVIFQKRQRIFRGSRVLKRFCDNRTTL